MPSSANSAHAHTNPREQIPDITASGVNTIGNATERQDRAIVKTLAKAAPKSKLSEILPPLIFGTATFNYQFNLDPYALHPNTIVHAALTSGIRAFDTSPYYGPAEEILGAALHSDLISSDAELSKLQRSDLFILTKAGRLTSDTFDYSDSWLRHSVNRSLARFKTSYLDVVYLHDVEFVTPAQVLSGIRTLRSIRDTTDTVKHIGICGYPVDTLCSLAEMIQTETGEALDIVQSYANFTIQNQRLLTHGLARLRDAGVDVVPNASPLGMGLCRSQGPPIGAMGNWHPAPDGLKAKCVDAASYTETTHGSKLETLAVRFAMENWLEVGASVGTRGSTPDEILNLNLNNKTSVQDKDRPRLGVNVIGISKLSELSETMDVYNQILFLTRSSSSTQTLAPASDGQEQKQHIRDITTHIRTQILGDEWSDYAWASPEVGFVNKRVEFGVSAAEREAFEGTGEIVEDGRYAAELELDLELKKTESHVEVQEITIGAEA